MSFDVIESTFDDVKAPIKGAFAMGPFGSRIKAENFVSEGVPVIKGGNLNGDLDKSSFDFLTPGKAVELSSSIARRLDLVITHRGTLGQVGIIPPYSKYPEYIVSQSQLKLTFDQNKVNPFFVYYFLKSSLGQRRLLANTSQVGVPAIAQALTSIRNIKIPLPSLIAQNEIVRVLRLIDDRIALLRDTNATLEAIAQALFKSWFVDFDPVHAKQEGRAPEGMDDATAALFPDSFEESELGLIPRGWRIGTVADIGEVICGKTPPTSEPENYGDDVPFITIPDMHNSLAVTSTRKSLSTLGANTQKKKTLPPGAICVSCIATAGLVARVTTPSQTNQQINSVVALDKWGKSFPLLTLRRIGDAVRAGGSGGSVFHNLSKSGFEQLKVLFPNEKLALAFGDSVEPIIEKIIANQTQSQIQATLRDTLLPRLISGQLRLPEPETMLEKAAA